MQVLVDISENLHTKLIGLRLPRDHQVLHVQINIMKAGNS